MGAIRRFWDPKGQRFGVPTFPWKLAPAHYRTRDQLAALGLRPQQPIAAQVMWSSRRGVRVAYLYDPAKAGPPKARTPQQITALEKARRRRRTCPKCGQEQEYYLSTQLGVCTPCADGFAAAA